MIYNIINNIALPVYEKTIKNSREWIFVDDQKDKKLIKLFFKGKNGEKYNIGSIGINCTNLSIIKQKLLKKELDTKNVKIKFVEAWT